MRKARKMIDWRLLIGVVVIAVMAIYFTTAGGTFFVNGKAVPANQGQPFTKAGVTYLPLDPIVKGMGDSYSFVGQYDRATINKKGKTFKVTTGKTVAIAGNKMVPLSTKLIGSGKKKVKVPAGHRALRINNVVYVPTEFVQTVLGYPVTIKGNTIYVGTVPTVEAPKSQPTQPTKPTPPPSQPTTPAPQPTTPAPQPTEPPKGNDPSTGWVAPTVNTSATTDGARNIQVLSDQLGFYKVGTYSAIFNPYTKANGPSSIVVNDDPSNSYDALVHVKVWGSSQNKEYNKTPYIVKEVLRFYGVSGVYDIVQKGFNGVNVESYLDKNLPYGNRQVKIVGQNDDTVLIYIGKPNQNLVVQ